MKEFSINTKIADLHHELRYRVVSCLINENITDVRQLLSFKPDELLRIPNFGEVSLKELEEYLEKRGMALGSMPKPKPKKEPKPKAPVWYWANDEQPDDHKKQVLFYTYDGEFFIGLFSREFGWMTPLPQNKRQSWDTLIRVTSSVMKWTYIPSPSYQRGIF